VKEEAMTRDAEPSRSFVIPLATNAIVTLEVEGLLTQDSWTRLLMILELYRHGLVADDGESFTEDSPPVLSTEPEASADTEIDSSGEEDDG
jgi:hypothetical protein